MKDLTDMTVTKSFLTLIAVNTRSGLAIIHSKFFLGIEGKKKKALISSLNMIEEEGSSDR